MSFWKKKTEKWVESPLHNNWYQSSSYFLSSFALITSVDEEGVARLHVASQLAVQCEHRPIARLVAVRAFANMREGASSAMNTPTRLNRSTSWVSS